ncbi:MAG: PTS sugar transporter subunit IIA [Candidatus Omnitrophica bacterium]|nr:PTS sugar transporter subunit IIA [Candidatus Omnitrophota bacterium]MDE2008613.1 PTS sugar transporter subunit IIA [Candidatus Omnitrophota bacterium]MDE2214079.1 PTS sugar transporter subunit IIA [Candidatus Omnitrophota bacterium]MDE2230943.1 PTS sugar transporter subunit IIA [Candidatus Omnitrophota bacterium]
MQISLRDIVEILHVSEPTIHRWIARDKMPCVKVNGQYHFNYIELLEWTLGHKINLTAEILALGEKENGHPGTLYHALKNGGIHYDVPGANRTEALQALVDRLPMPAKINKEEMCGLLLRREELMSTAIGGGIAIPHVRNPVVVQVQESAVALCFLKGPVDFKALDGNPVSIVFGLLSSSVKEHLSLLARLAFCLQNSSLRQSLQQKSTPEQILGEIRILESKLADRPKEKSSS